MEYCCLAMFTIRLPGQPSVWALAMASSLLAIAIKLGFTTQRSLLPISLLAVSLVSLQASWVWFPVGLQYSLKD